MKATPKIFDVIERHAVFTFDAAQVQTILRNAALAMLDGDVDATPARVSTVIDMKGVATVEVVQRLQMDVTPMGRAKAPPLVEAVPPVTKVEPPKVDEPKAVLPVPDPAPTELPNGLMTHLRAVPEPDPDWTLEDDLYLLEARIGGRSTHAIADEIGRPFTFVAKRMTRLVESRDGLWKFEHIRDGIEQLIRERGARMSA